LLHLSEYIPPESSAFIKVDYETNTMIEKLINRRRIQIKTIQEMLFRNDKLAESNKEIVNILSF